MRRGRATSMKWFGTSWGAPVCEETRHVATPTGDACFLCKRAIEEHDRGLVTPCIDDVEVKGVPSHLDCFLETPLRRMLDARSIGL